jgi:hypothetical protein
MYLVFRRIVQLFQRYLLLEYYTNKSVAYCSVVLHFCNLFAAIVRRDYSHVVWSKFIDQRGASRDFLYLAVTENKINDPTNDSSTMIKMLLEEDLSLNNYADNETIFHVACKRGNHRLTETVIKLGAKIYPESETTRNLFYSLAHRRLNYSKTVKRDYIFGDALKWRCPSVRPN